MDIQFNELNAIPGTLLELPNLVNLNISNNKLTTFPHLGKWSQSLAILDVSFNRLNTIPGEPTASSINTLNLANNELSAVPLCICSFTTLRFLDLSNNAGILTLPMQMYKLKELRYLNLKGLINLSGIPKSIQHDSQKVIGYFKSKSLPTTGYYRMKLMLVGKQNRGKTTLAARLQGRSCGNTSTVGVYVNEWEYKPSIGKKSFQFSIWDFGGQEEYYATHQCFLSERALYLVLFNLLHGVEGVKEMIPWLNNIALRAPNSCVLIVGTHLDEIPAAQRKEKADKLLQKAADIAGGFCNKLQIYQVMAVGLKDPLEGVTDLRDSIYQCAAEYKFSNGEFVMGQKIPISYSKLDKHILWFQKRARQCNLIPIMNKEEFKALVKDLNLTDICGDNELKLATTFLTDIGTLLYYDDRSHHLDELYFLDPQWLCDIMAKVVTVKESNPFVSNGILAVKDVPLLFRGEKFPWQYFKQYVALLDRFDIALPLDRNRILIPSMLSEVRPEGVDVAEPHEMPFYTRLVIFNSPTTPSGFWSRLISRILHAIPGVRRTILLEGATNMNPEIIAVDNSDDQIPTTNFEQLNYESTVFYRNLSVSTSDANSSISMTSVADALQAKLLYWQTGLFYQNNQVFFRVESLSHTMHKKEGVEITASFSTLGRIVISQILDFVSALVKDWYPGLQDRGSLNQFIFCCECMRLKRTNPYQFDVQSCLSLIGQNMASIECMYSRDPSENHSVLLADIVPDLLLQDISVKYLLNISELDYKEEENLLLGTGGFGKVYRGRCHGKSVAIKRYLKGDEALSELRKEAMILQQFHHPCLVCLVGVCVHPIMAMVLEEAPMGSLESPLIKARLPIHRLVIHRIAVQVAAALNFLHEGGIIFRDLKAANVLLWSLDPESLCHCKVTDFGIATNLTPIGARGIIGTKGFIAPEVLHVGKKREHSLYDHKADIFSFGMFLYQMIYRRHPFHDMLPVRIDSAVENGERPRLDDVSESDNVYFFLTRLMQCCWQADPRNRPATAEIIDKLCFSSFQSLMSMRSAPFSLSHCKACAITEKEFSEAGAGHRESEIWVCFDGDSGMEINAYSTSTLVLLSKNVLNGIKAQCISMCGQYVWAGLKDGNGNGVIEIFSITSRASSQKILLKGDVVSCMTYINQVVYCGTFKGFCLSFSKNTQQTQIFPKGSSKKLSENVIDGIVVTSDCIWLSHACVIAILNIDTLEMVGELDRKSYPDGFIGQLHMSEDRGTIWSCQLISTCVSAWSTDKKAHMVDIDIKNYASTITTEYQDELETSITAVVPVLDTVWVGLESGHILIFCHKELLTWFQPYKSYVQFLLCIPCEGPNHLQRSLIISGGEKFNSSMVPGLVENENASDSGILVKWEAFPSKTYRQISLVQSQSSTFLQNHECTKSVIRIGGFKDDTFLMEDHSVVADAEQTG